MKRYLYQAVFQLSDRVRFIPELPPSQLTVSVTGDNPEDGLREATRRVENMIVNDAVNAQLIQLTRVGELQQPQIQTSPGYIPLGRS